MKKSNLDIFFNPSKYLCHSTIKSDFLKVLKWSDFFFQIDYRNTAKNDTS